LPLASQSSRSHRKPKGEGHSRRGEILAAAERIFVEHGYEGATIRKIADEVGLSSTALYMHFPDKGAILQEICRNAFSVLTAAAASLSTGSAPPEVRLRAMIEAYAQFGFDQPNAYRLIYLTRPVEAREGAQTLSQELGAVVFSAFGDLVEETVAAGRMEGDARAIAQSIWAAAHGVVSLMITKPYFPWVERDRLVKTTLDAVFDGLLKP
jgi:AcrR family transcriptional regulator